MNRMEKLLYSNYIPAVTAPLKVWLANIKKEEVRNNVERDFCVSVRDKCVMRPSCSVRSYLPALCDLQKYHILGNG